MKKALLLFSVIAAFYSCKQTSKTSEPAATAVADTSGLHALDAVSYGEAKKIVGLYKVDSVTMSSGPNGPKLKAPDSRCVFFSIKEMATLIAEISAEHGSGIRVYYATYPDSTVGYGSGGNALNYSKLNTVVIVSTRDSISNGVSYNSDYYTNPNPSIHTPTKNRFLVADPTNKGELCPPPSDCTSIGAYLLKP